MEPKIHPEKSLELTEWEEKILNFCQEDYVYMNGNFKDTLVYKEIGTKALVQTKQYVGIIRFPGSDTILKINPKITSKYMELLRYAQSIKCNDGKKFLYYDFKEKIEAEEGEVFLEIIAHLFLMELRYIFKRGLYKEYVRKEENISFLRGKLLIPQQIRKNFIRPKFYCSYFDLTVDNFVNQAMLYAALKVTKIIDCRSNPDLKSLKAEILKYVNLLKNEITLKDVILLSDLANLTVNRKCDYYEEITDLTKIIIRESFFGSAGQRKSRSCNFLIDMNVIFERVVFGLLSKILKEKGFSVKDQVVHYVNDFIYLDNKSLKIRPDIIVFKDNEEYAVVDAKYMASVSNKEYYQIITYSLALRIKDRRSFKNAILVNFESDTSETRMKSEGTIKIANLINRPAEDIKIYQISIYLGDERDNYLRQIETQLRQVIESRHIF